ncbi:MULTISPECIES: mechanosensitive ion channel family protein [Chryseobacterium]|jgi:small conductance mechanosensitive channel|uniref:Mechanosensitive ion channel family protein n=1 Tax=Chryseobacterium rhizosphaerae TaxID=395937 RepID=A0ABX9IFC9_9FLAO|nr:MULTISPECIES: mechanosensitive ion channel family protein [Chryseobacterium]MDC8098648.1 mechanosensitive ion channel family protein [Chryseobacterium rhizosphaerae]MDR6547449.1 small conductance mechanosensitive channel [Chryseobacterium rhizosphaerae]REC71633.1 mechanosensitive ion channel family protein [Chryseobacterium rhizosphaerae]SMC50810.1 Small-conductance mechanosensitive channel [Chryseobacterium sp. YR221]GEN68136.1 mechanosensitive ion channel protein MscS [Chryseobacterium rh
MEKTGLSYVDLVYKVLESWYITFAELTPKLIVGILVFTFFLITSKYLSLIAVKLFHRFFPKSKKESSLVTLIGVFRFLIMLFGSFISLEIMGFSGFLWKFIGSLGVAGVIAGVALKDLVSSIFSGMLIGIDKAFKVGDYITIGTHSGTVQEIGFLTTKILTDDGKKAYIPNQVVFNAPFYNITASPQRRIILNFEIPADEDISKAQKSILDVIKNLDNVDKLDTIEVIFTDLKQGSFNLQVKFWIKIGANLAQVRSKAYLGIKERFDVDKIQLVTPTSISITSGETNATENQDK